MTLPAGRYELVCNNDVRLHSGVPLGYLGEEPQELSVAVQRIARVGALPVRCRGRFFHMVLTVKSLTPSCMGSNLLDQCVTTSRAVDGCKRRTAAPVVNGWDGPPFPYR